ncbi:hypothetical protein ON010_g14857 [Phytophthora cinnamomi]|nr:hypothetical protein ON010_g14857 [Phytophthora cinnamomi]
MRPIVSADKTGIRYDGFTTISQGDALRTYMIVDDAGYMVTTSEDPTISQTVECLSSVSPFDIILPALNNASVVSSSVLSGESIQCPSGPLLPTYFGGVDFALCTAGKSGKYHSSTRMQSMTKRTVRRKAVDDAHELSVPLEVLVLPDLLIKNIVYRSSTSTSTKCTATLKIGLSADWRIQVEHSFRRGLVVNGHLTDETDAMKRTTDRLATELLAVPEIPPDLEDEVDADEDLHSDSSIESYRGGGGYLSSEDEDPPENARTAEYVHKEIEDHANMDGFSPYQEGDADSDDDSNVEEWSC